MSSDHQDSDSERRLQGIVESAMDAIITIDESYRIVLFNPAAEQMFGVPRATALGQPLTRFIPERFSREREAQLPRYAYIPFGAGSRICIGNIFAMMEARLILATVAQRFRPVMPEGATVVPEQLITIRPKGGLKMVLTERRHDAKKVGEVEAVGV